jgi:hypothetical protein
MAKAKKRIETRKKASKRGKASVKPAHKKAAKRATTKKRPRKAAARMAPRKAPRPGVPVIEDTIIDVIDAFTARTPGAASAELPWLVFARVKERPQCKELMRIKAARQKTRKYVS